MPAHISGIRGWQFMRRRAVHALRDCKAHAEARADNDRADALRYVELRIESELRGLAAYAISDSVTMARVHDTWMDEVSS